MARAISLRRRKVETFSNDNESLNLYLKEISEFPLLSKKEEVELAKGIQAGDPRALEKLVNSNLRFVVSVAKTYKGLPLEDLINEGNIGLVKAAKRFDPFHKQKQEKDPEKRKKIGSIKFISYAVWWIRQVIMQALAEGSRPVRLPLNRVGDIYKISKMTSALEQNLKKRVTIEDVIEQFPNKNPMDVIDGVNLLKAPLSFDGPVSRNEGGDTDNTFHDVISDTTTPNAESNFSDSELRDICDEVLDELTPREKEVIDLYFGRYGEKPLTLEEIGARFDLTRERIRQIKKKAIRRLRHASRSKKLAPYHYY